MTISVIFKDIVDLKFRGFSSAQGVRRTHPFLRCSHTITCINGANFTNSSPCWCWPWERLNDEVLWIMELVTKLHQIKKKTHTRVNSLTCCIIISTLFHKPQFTVIIILRVLFLRVFMFLETLSTKMETNALINKRFTKQPIKNDFRWNGPIRRLAEKEALPFLLEFSYFTGQFDSNCFFF